MSLLLDRAEFRRVALRAASHHPRLARLAHMNEREVPRLEAVLDAMAAQFDADARAITGLRGPRGRARVITARQYVRELVDHVPSHIGWLATALPSAALATTSVRALAEAAGHAAAGYATEHVGQHTRGDDHVVYVAENLAHAIGELSTEGGRGPDDALRKVGVHERVHVLRDQHRAQAEGDSTTASRPMWTMEGYLSLTDSSRVVGNDPDSIATLADPWRLLEFLARFTPDTNVRLRTLLLIERERDQTILREGDAIDAEYMVESPHDDPRRRELFAARLRHGDAATVYSEGFRTVRGILDAVAADPLVLAAHGGMPRRFLGHALATGQAPNVTQRANLPAWVRATASTMDSRPRVPLGP